MNQPGEQLLGFSQPEILNLNISRLVVAEYRGLFQKLIERTLDSQTQTFEEIELITKDGHTVRLEVATHPIYQHGKPIEIQGVAANPSEQFAYERQVDRSRYIPNAYSQSKGALAENGDRIIYYVETANNFPLQESR